MITNNSIQEGVTMYNSLSPENNFLKQYFENSIVPQLLIDSELFLKDFTPAAGRLFKLNKEHLDRNICGIKEKMKHKSFIENVRGVLITETVLEKEIKLSDERRFLMCIQPYFSENEEAITGLIVTFTQLETPAALIEENKRLKSENQELKEFLYRELTKSRK
ncbi:PAS domain-containing protein [Salegentibacter salinarum]|nr:PAS domain-containing protein [Salegentibacter salinarum]SKB78751.1 PAS domain-containing protein [Salegentibacter salinarum]